MHQPLLAELDSEEKTRELQARLGISVFHQVVSAQQILDLACMFVILFCILTRPSLFSFCLLVFLSFYTLHAGYPWQAAARYLIIPVCLIIFVQYIGSFASVLALPAGIRSFFAFPREGVSFRRGLHVTPLPQFPRESASPGRPFDRTRRLCG